MLSSLPSCLLSNLVFLPAHASVTFLFKLPATPSFLLLRPKISHPYSSHSAHIQSEGISGCLLFQNISRTQPVSVGGAPSLSQHSLLPVTKSLCWAFLAPQCSFTISFKHRCQSDPLTTWDVPLLLEPPAVPK
jgi:hypothetical protein